MQWCCSFDPKLQTIFEFKIIIIITLAIRKISQSSSSWSTNSDPLSLCLRNNELLNFTSTTGKCPQGLCYNYYCFSLLVVSSQSKRKNGLMLQEFYKHYKEWINVTRENFSRMSNYENIFTVMMYDSQCILYCSEIKYMMHFPICGSHKKSIQQMRRVPWQC